MVRYTSGISVIVFKLFPFPPVKLSPEAAFLSLITLMLLPVTVVFSRV